jgi:hypothetical protein
MRRLWTSAVVLSLAAVAAADDKPKPADTPAEKAKADTPAEKLAALKKEVAAAPLEMSKKMQELSAEDRKDAKKVAELRAEMTKGQTKRFEEALALAKADPKSEVAADAVVWLLQNQPVMFGPLAKPALEFATENLADSPKIAPAVFLLGRVTTPDVPFAKDAEAFLKAVEAKNKDKTVVGLMAYAKAQSTLTAFERAESQKGKDNTALADAAEKALEAVVKEHGDVKVPSSRGASPTIAEVVKPSLFELRNLRIGKAAPDIEAEDLDGTKFKLSDYKGKVVVLDFWGDW